MKVYATIIAALFGIISLFAGFVYGTPELEQLCEVLLLLSFVLYTDKKTYISLLMQGYLIGACIELIDERYHLNNGTVLMNDYTFTGAWVLITLIRLYRHKRTK